MIFSAQQLFSDNQAIVGTAVSTNVLDTLATGTPAHAAAAIEKDLGKGTPIPMSIRVTEIFNLLTSLKIALEVDDNEAMASATEVLSISVAAADLVVGYDTPFQYVPKGTDERYMRLTYTVVGTNPSTGEIMAGIVAGLDNTWGA